jgi:glycerol-3-phosphate acyltransferase PlsY
MTAVSSFISILAIGYLLSIIPTANIVMHLFKKQDLQKLGTGNVTSTAGFCSVLITMKNDCSATQGECLGEELRYPDR